MKILLLTLLISICVIGYRNPDVLDAIGLAHLQKGREQEVMLPASPVQTGASTRLEQPAISMHEFADLAKKDPQAYQKFLDGLKVKEERSEVDKLMNFLSRGKYE